MKQFIACMCENDLAVLIKSGQPTFPELAEAWASLFYEYCDLVEATETTYRVRLVHQINTEKRKNEIVGAWVKVMEMFYSEPIANALRTVGFDYEFDVSDVEQYFNDLSRVKGELSVNRLRVRILEAEHEAIIANQSTNDSVDEKYFRTIFFRINNYAKREAVNGLTTVQDYCVALKDYVAYIEMTNKNPANR